MRQRLPLSLLALAAVLLSATSLSAVFDDQGWLRPVIGAALVATLAGSLSRLAGRSRSGSLLLGLLLSGTGFACYVTAVFVPSSGWFGFIPTGATVSALHELVRSGFDDVHTLVSPAPSNPGLVLFATAGTYLVAALTDAIAVGLRRPAVAGLPLLLLFSFPVGVAKGGVGWLPFLAAGTGYVALLLAEGRAQTRTWGRAVPGPASRRQPSAAALPAITGRRIGLAALGVALVLPLAFPVSSTKFLSGGAGGGAGGPTRVAPMVDVAQRLHSSQVVNLLHVQTTTPDYLRLTALDVFDGSTFQPAPRQSLAPGRVDGSLPRPSYRGPTRHVSMRITATDQYADRFLPVAIDPVGVFVTGDWRRAPATDSILSDVDTTKDRTWVVEAATPTPSPELLAAAGAPTRQPRLKLDVELPSGLDPRIRKLAQRIGDAAGFTTYAKVSAIQEYLRSAPFTYDLEGAPTGRHALSTFLFGTHRGYCEQFASAMTVLARELGIPARVAIGFTAGDSDGHGGYTITTADAHAWPEIWFNGTGWIRFEPTPRGDGSAIPPSYTFPPAAADPSSSFYAGVPGTVPPPGGNNPLAAAPNPGQGAQSNPIASSGTPAATSSGLSNEQLALIAFGALLLLLIASPGISRAHVRRRRLGRQATTAGAWQEVIDSLADLGIPARASESPRGLARRLTGGVIPGRDGAADGALVRAMPRRRGAPAPTLESLPPAASESLWELALEEERRRYALAGSKADNVQGDRVRAVRAGLVGDRARTQRLLAAAFPRSTLAKARRWIGAGVANALDRGDLIMTSTVRRLPFVAGGRRRQSAER